MVFGVPSIVEFVFPIIVGIIAGTYSSVFLAVSLWVIFKDLQGKIREKRLKVKEEKAKTEKVKAKAKANA